MEKVKEFVGVLLKFCLSMVLVFFAITMVKFWSGGITINQNLTVRNAEVDKKAKTASFKISGIDYPDDLDVTLYRGYGY